MAQLNIDEDFWNDPRIELLADLVKSRDLANGMVLRAMRLAQRYWAPKTGESRKLIPKSIWDTSGLDALCECDLAIRRDSGVYLRGSSDRFEWLVTARERGRVGGLKSAIIRAEKLGTNQATLRQLPKQPSSNPQATLRDDPNLIDTDTDTDISFSTETADAAPVATAVEKMGRRKKAPSEAPLGSQVWNSYAEAFRLRYKTDPARSAKANAICKRLVQSLGVEKAKTIVAVFLKDNDQAVTQRAHPLEWIEGRVNIYLVNIDTGSKPSVTTLPSIPKHKDLSDPEVRRGW